MFSFDFFVVILGCSNQVECTNNQKRIDSPQGDVQVAAYY